MGGEDEALARGESLDGLAGVEGEADAPDELATGEIELAFAGVHQFQELKVGFGFGRPGRSVLGVIMDFGDEQRQRLDDEGGDDGADQVEDEGVPRWMRPVSRTRAMTRVLVRDGDGTGVAEGDGGAGAGDGSGVGAVEGVEDGDVGGWRWRWADGW
jgi:hypothetical protein